MKFSKAEIDAVIAASPRTTVAFNKLMLSPSYQARPAGTASKMSVAELAASIKTNALFHNLIVVKGGRGLHEVCAGGRRLATLTLLVNNGDLPENYPVPVMIVPADKALMASLVENVQREALFPPKNWSASPAWSPKASRSRTWPPPSASRRWWSSGA